MKTISILLISISIFSLFGCKSNSEEVSDKIILKIGKVEITEYEFEKNKKRYFNPGSGQSYKQWKSNFINEAYFLADALDKGYDTIPDIKIKVDYTAQAMISKVDGYLWNKLAKPQLEFSKQELKDAYNKRNKIYYLEYLKFPNKKVMTEILGNNTTIKTEADYIMAANKCRANNNIYHENRAYIFPFGELHILKNLIINIIKPNTFYTSEGIYIINPIKTESIRQGSFSHEKDQILNELKRIKTREIIKEKSEEVFFKAKISTNNKVKAELIKQLNASSPTIVNDTLLTFRFKGKVKPITCKEFLDYYKNTPFTQKIENKTQLEETIKNAVMQKIEYTEADSLGIFSDIQYVLDKRNYRNRVILPQYFKNELYDSILVADDEILDCYKKNTKRFTEPETCHVSLLKFKTKNAAIENYAFVSELLKNKELESINDTSLVRNLVSFEPEIILKKDNSDLPDNLIQEIFAAKLQFLGGPFVNKQNHILFFKTKEVGLLTKTYKAAKDEIKASLEDKKLKHLKEDKISRLKNKYPITINKIN